MTEYFTALISVSALISIAAALSYKDMGESRALRAAFAVILLYVTVMPLLGALSNFDADDFKFGTEDYDFGGENAAGELTREAFERGVRLYICQEFSLDGDDVSVTVSGFDPIAVRAEKISVRLSGRAAFADFRAIKARLSKNGFDNCEVLIEKR